jgi:two-component system, OmpR family, clock-associated histidine kinase SasA
VTSDDIANYLTVQLLLFVDDRPNALEISSELQAFLASKIQNSQAELQIVNVSEHPDLAELFKVVMTPALIKTSPLPRQTLTGKNIIIELQNHWITWEAKVDPNLSDHQASSLSNDLNHSIQVLRLRDQIFKLNQAKLELEAQLHFKNRVISMLAHDLRNPLTAVSLALETVEISGDKLSASKKSELFQHARRQVKICNGMIIDILEASDMAERNQ